MSNVSFKFHIEGATPKTVSAERLLRYLMRVTKILGEPDYVHFVEIKEGSIQTSFEVSEEAQSRVQNNLHAIKQGIATESTKKHIKEIQLMLEKDNASAKLGNEKDEIEFPGIKKPAFKKIGPIKEKGNLSGYLTKLEGIDDTKHIALLRNRTTVSGIKVNTAIAKELKQYLFEDLIVNLSGHGKWTRDTDGIWLLEEFITTSFDILDNTTLDDLTELYPDAIGDWSDVDDPLSYFTSLRHG